MKEIARRRNGRFGLIWNRKGNEVAVCGEERVKTPRESLCIQDLVQIVSQDKLDRTVSGPRQ
jgi:hypothetical protein